ncbi:hypothetical protein P0F65_04950 [Sphingomonas sp. I4]
MKDETKAVAGAPCTSAGVPICSITPPRITTMRSAISSASS